MSYSIIPTPNFEREFKQLQKKYPSLKSDLIQISEALLTHPTQGVEIYKNCFKMRFAIKSKGKGKSGGGRLESVADSFLRQLLKNLDED